jgi:uncharacterized protein
MLSVSQIQTIVEVFRPYNPKRISVFGSVARGDEAGTSDIDILYEFSEPISLFEKASLKESLETRLKKGVDLVSEKYLSMAFKDAIRQDVKVIYGG